MRAWVSRFKGMQEGLQLLMQVYAWLAHAGREMQVGVTEETI